ncbi:hypothetical protein [Planctellipticum variicoloris]|uniref:hypothetical protein n=1 Tax=Planctellipticum variicoloris TaxID=3064265 RepID=UPI003013AE93|nr:hypothetical protein SH412_004853 [Planctomycetaceae bacterium SH412]
MSGIEHHFDKIVLFNSVGVRNLQALAKSASQKSAGIASPIGAIGSFEWVAKVMVANMVVEHLANKALQAAANADMDKYQRVLKAVRTNAIAIPLSKIENVHLPIPASWHAQIAGPEPDENGARRMASYIHTGDQFVGIERNGERRTIIWDKVEEYDVA